MKTLFKLIVICLLSINAQALALTAPPVKDLIAEITTTKFKYTETGIAYGFAIIKSCVYTEVSLKI